MEEIKTILLALDGSNESYQAVKAAKITAKAHGAAVVVFGCLNLNELSSPPEFSPVSFAMAIEKAETGLKEHLESVAGELAEAGIETTVRLNQGKPVRAIVDAANELDSDLIVMASHGRSGLQRLLLGSVAEGVLRKARRPVLVQPVS